MTDPVITHATIRSFAEKKVNLPGENAQAHRDQANRLRERLKQHIASNPGFALVKMLHAGSVAKGPALRMVNDLDMAVYVQKEKVPAQDKDLVPWVAARLREAKYPNMSDDQFDDSKPHCVPVDFKGSGLNVEFVPVLYEGDKDDFGYLVNQDSGERTLTSIPLHLEFIRKRKDAQPTHFAQVVRLVKWWIRYQKSKDVLFKFKSFMAELILARLADDGLDCSDYYRALQAFFTYIVRTGLEQRVYFTDYYNKSKLPASSSSAIEILDPVNAHNNVAILYGVEDRKQLVNAADDAASAIAEAKYSTTKSRAIECWQVVLGPSFRG